MMPDSAVTALRLALRQNGYSPLPCEGKRPAMKAWEQRIECSGEEIALWDTVYSLARNTGVLTRTMPALDIDIMSHAAAEAVEDLVRERFEERGYILVRIGQAPKRAIVFRTNEPFGKITANVVSPAGGAEKIELLCSGQQLIAYGLHPATRAPYRWHGGEPGQIAHDDLPYLSAQEAQALVEEAAALLVAEHGYTRADERPKGNGAASAGGADWSWLLANIAAGRELHDSADVLAAKLIAAGMSEGAAVNLIRGVFEASVAPHDERWRERYADIPRDVASAVRKFRPAANDLNGSNDLDGLGELDVGTDCGPRPPRQWLLGNQFCCGYISSVVAAGGTGKTALRMLQYLSLASGRSLSGDHIFRRARVLLISLEDDDVELGRRIDAVLLHYKIDRGAVAGWLLYKAPQLTRIAQTDEQTRTRVRGKLEMQIRDCIERWRAAGKPIDLVALDPFVKTHGLKENDSGDMDFVCGLLAAIAVDYGVAVDSPHHVHKGQIEAGDADAGRGSTGIRDAARLVYTLCSMAAEEANEFAIEPEQRRFYVRLDPAKTNIAAPPSMATWFHLVGVPLGNGTSVYPAGDTVQVAVPWTPPDALAGMTTHVANLILDQIKDGVKDEDGRPTGDPFSLNRKGSKRWAGSVVQEFLQCDEAVARKVLAAWIKNEVITEYQARISTSKGEMRGCLRVNDGKRPGMGHAF